MKSQHYNSQIIILSGRFSYFVRYILYFDKPRNRHEMSEIDFEVLPNALLLLFTQRYT